MATLETKYKNYLKKDKDSNFTFEEWKEWWGKMIGQSLPSTHQKPVNNSLPKKMTLFQLKPIKLWTEKSIQWPEGSLRIYIADIHIGTAVPKKNGEDMLFTFHNKLDHVVHMSGKEWETLDEIITNIELSLKEFCRKIIK